MNEVVLSPVAQTVGEIIGLVTLVIITILALYFVIAIIIDSFKEIADQRQFLRECTKEEREVIARYKSCHKISLWIFKKRSK